MGRKSIGQATTPAAGGGLVRGTRRRVRDDRPGWEEVRRDDGGKKPAIHDKAEPLAESSAGPLARNGPRRVSLTDAGYPVLLSQIADPPAYLFMDGSACCQDDASLAIVGSRRPSQEGLAVAWALAAEAGRRGITVVSGLAHGIDSAAHEGAIAAGGRTLAVLGTGIDKLVAPANAALAPAIRGSGCLISQFQPGTEPQSDNFLQRNRVVAGIALASMIIEGKPLSGTWDEAQHAARHGRLLLGWKPLLKQDPWLERLRNGHRVVLAESVEDVLDAFDRERTTLSSKSDP